jgi:hypothetical protein
MARRGIQTQTIIVFMLLRLAETFRTISGPNAKTVQLNMGLSDLTPDLAA